MSDILAFGEIRNGTVRDITYELITAATRLADSTGGSAHAALIADSDVDTDPFQRSGLSTFHLIEHDGGYNNAHYVDIIEQFVREREPGVIILPHTVSGMDYAPAVASRLDRTLITNAVDVNYDEGFLVTRKIYEGKVDCTVQVDRDDFVVTLRGGQLPAAEPGEGVEIRRYEPESLGPSGTEVLDFREVDLGDDVDITKADYIVSVGLGIGEEENMDVVRKLVDATGGVLASSRPIVERGWLPRSRQVGQSGETVEPRVYVALGISGAIEHRVGMKSSETIIAVNNDPDAPIFDIADYGVVDDLKEVVPELIDQLDGGEGN